MCAEPEGPELTPVAKKIAACQYICCSAASMREVSTICPRPVRSRAWSAGDDAERREDSRIDVAIDVPDLTGWRPGSPVTLMIPRTLEDEVEAGLVRIRPGAAVTRDRAVDEARVQLLQDVLISEPELFQGALAIVLGDDIRVAQQLLHHL
jgi:hypothetical protein